MTNTKRHDPLQEARNHEKNRIRYQKRIQEDKEAEKALKEELARQQEKRDDNDTFF